MYKCQTKPLDYTHLKTSLDAALKVFTVINGDFKVIASNPHPQSTLFKKFLNLVLSRLPAQPLAKIYDRITAVIDEVS